MSRDWNAEQTPLQDEQEAALSERIRLKLSDAPTADELSLFAAAVSRHELAKRRISEFLSERIKADPSWRGYSANSPVSWFTSSSVRRGPSQKVVPIGQKSDKR